MRGRNWTQEEVAKFFVTQGCVLLDQYEKTRIPLHYLCTCGQKGTISLVGLFARQKEQKPFCRHNKARHTTEEVRTAFSAVGCILLTEEYFRPRQRLTFLCSCGRANGVISFDKLQTCGRALCPICRHEVKSAKTKAAMSDARVLEKRRITWMTKYGVPNAFQSELVKSKCKATNKARYGVEYASQCDLVKQKQKATFLANFGVTHFMKNPELLTKYRNTMIERYGAPSLAFVSGRSSNEAQKFFTALFKMLPKENFFTEHCYFSPRTHEFNVWFENKYYKYDFVLSHYKKAIEYNGTRFHPRPEQAEDEIGWCLYHPDKTVRSARAYEEHKMQALRIRGFEILTIWDTEVKHDLNSCLSRCLAFLLSKPEMQL